MGTNKTFAKDRDRALREQDRATLRKLRGKVQEAKRALAEWKRTHPRRRRELLSEIRGMVQDARRADAGKTRTLATALVRRREAYHAWWANVLRERLAWIAELERLRAELKLWRKGRAARVEEYRAIFAGEKAKRQDELEQQLDREADALFGRVEKATEAYRVEQRRQKQARQDERVNRYNFRARRLPERDRRRDVEAEVIANLSTAVELAWWRHAKRQTLAEAKRRGVTAPDAIAEVAREMAELHPEDALGYLIADTEQWVREEVRKQEAA